MFRNNCQLTEQTDEAKLRQITLHVGTPRIPGLGTRITRSSRTEYRPEKNRGETSKPSQCSANIRTLPVLGGHEKSSEGISVRTLLILPAKWGGMGHCASAP